MSASRRRPGHATVLLTGRVQGVGFRPFVYRLAHELGLDGLVRNLRGDVEVVRVRPAARIDRRFAREIVDAGAAARTCRRSVRGRPPSAPGRAGFRIAASSAADAPQISVPPDFFCCADCLAELADPAIAAIATPSSTARSADRATR